MENQYCKFTQTPTATPMETQPPLTFMENQYCEFTQTLTAPPVETQPPIMAALEHTTAETDTVPSVMGITSIVPASNLLMGGSNTAGSEKQKKRRGRPRKWGSDGRLSSSTAAPSRSIDSSEQNKKGRPHRTEESQILASTGGFVADTAQESFTPHVIMVYPGQDVVETLLTLFEEGYSGFFILCANGILFSAALRHLNCVGIMNYEGRYEILSLQGSYVMEGMGVASGRKGQLTLTLGDPKGEKVFGGTVEGPLIAASPIQVVVGTFKPNIKSKTERCPAQFPTSPRKISLESSSSLGRCPAESSAAAAARMHGNEEKGLSTVSELMPITNEVLPFNVIPANQNMWSTALNGVATDNQPISNQGTSNDANPSAPHLKGILPFNVIPANQNVWSASLNGVAADNQPISNQGTSNDANPSAPHLKGILPFNVIPANQNLWSASLNCVAAGNQSISNQGTSNDANPSAPHLKGYGYSCPFQKPF